jgi:hypothetical protein
MDQLVDISQTRAIGHGIHHAVKYMDGERTLKEVIVLVSRDMDREGLEVLTPTVTGDLARFRGIELAAAINRMRRLCMRQKR